MGLWQTLVNDETAARNWVTGAAGAMVTILSVVVTHLIAEGPDALAGWTARQWFAHVITVAVGTALTLYRPGKATPPAAP